MTPSHTIYWDLPILIVVVSLVYSATRFDDWRDILREAFRWGRRMAVFLGSIGLGLFFVAWWSNSGTGLWMLIAGLGIEGIVLLVWFRVFEKP